MNNFLRNWLLKVLPPTAVQLIRNEVLPRYRKWVKVLCILKKPGLMKRVSSRPDSFAVQMKLGDVLCKLGQPDEAIGCYEKAINIKPNLLAAHLELERLLRFNGQEKVVDKKGNRIFDNRTYNLGESSLSKLLACCKRMVERFPDSVEANFRMGNALIMALGNRQEASYYFHQATKLRIAQSHAKGNFGPIFVASMHRSASGFIRRSLIEGLGMPKDIPEVTPCTDWWYPEITIPVPPYALTTEPILDALSVGHTSALPQNLTILNLCVDRMVVNVRDPRQGLISYIHYIKNYFRHTNNREGLLESHIPQNYFLFSLTDQISWQIDNFYLPATIKWIQGWLDAEESTSFYPETLFTTQEDLVANPRNYFGTILKFYEIDKSRFTFPGKPEFKKNTPMRKGRVDEWREVFTPQQVKRASGMIPKRLIKKFGWQEKARYSYVT